MINSIFQALPLLSAALALWIGGSFGLDLHRYFRLSSSAPVAVKEWKVEEYRPGKFIIAVDYQFQVGDRPYKKSFRFPKPIYLNPYAAKNQVEFWKKQEWNVWYASSDPTYSSLQKMFPFRKGIHLLLCLSVIFYFVWLRFYIARVNPTS